MSGQALPAVLRAKPGLRQSKPKACRLPIAVDVVDDDCGQDCRISDDDNVRIFERLAAPDQGAVGVALDVAIAVEDIARESRPSELWVHQRPELADVGGNQSLGPLAGSRKDGFGLSH